MIEVLENGDIRFRRWLPFPEEPVAGLRTEPLLPCWPGGAFTGFVARDIDLSNVDLRPGRVWYTDETIDSVRRNFVIITSPYEVWEPIEDEL